MSGTSPPWPVTCYLGLGGNLGDVADHLRFALAELVALPWTCVVAVSRPWHTPPWGLAEQPPFLNLAVEIVTGLAPLPLLDRLLAIERRAGRVRAGTRWGPRTLDIDILAYGGRCIRHPRLHVPHPQLAARAFALAPLADLAPDLVLPGCGPVAALLAAADRRGLHPAAFIIDIPQQV